MLNAFDQLALERERTQFVLYGYRMADGRQGGPYFKLANSLSEALADLHEHTGIADEGGYVVEDAFLERGEEGEAPTVHVELISIAGIISNASEGDD